MSAIFLEIFNMSISASYLIAAVALIRLVLKKAPKWISVALFAVVAVRLVCPFSIESVLSLIPSAHSTTLKKKGALPQKRQPWSKTEISFFWINPPQRCFWQKKLLKIAKIFPL